MFALPSITAGGSTIRNVQSGTTTMSSTTIAVTISRVDTTKAFVYVLSAPSSANQPAKGRLTDSVTLTLVANATGGVVDWQVVEFN